MGPSELLEHMDHMSTHYNVMTANAIQEQYEANKDNQEEMYRPLQESGDVEKVKIFSRVSTLLFP
jgi:actin-related protein